MAVASTYATVKSQLVTSLAAHADLAAADVTYGWRAWAKSEQVFLGDVEGESTIPTQKSGRKHRQETYTIDVVFRVYDLDGTPTGDATTEARAAEMMAALDDILADDVQIDGVTAIQWAQVGEFTSRLVPQDKGWGCEVLTTVEVEARLQ